MRYNHNCVISKDWVGINRKQRFYVVQMVMWIGVFEDVVWYFEILKPSLFLISHNKNVPFNRTFFKFFNRFFGYNFTFVNKYPVTHKGWDQQHVIA